MKMKDLCNENPSIAQKIDYSRRTVGDEKTSKELTLQNWPANGNQSAASRNPHQNPSAIPSRNRTKCDKFIWRSQGDAHHLAAGNI